MYSKPLFSYPDLWTPWGHGQFLILLGVGGGRTKWKADRWAATWWLELRACTGRREGKRWKGRNVRSWRALCAMPWNINSSVSAEPDGRCHTWESMLVWHDLVWMKYAQGSCPTVIFCNPRTPLLWGMESGLILMAARWLCGLRAQAPLPPPTHGPSQIFVSNRTLSSEKKGTVVFPFVLSSHPQSVLILTQTMISDLRSYKSDVSLSSFEISCLHWWCNQNTLKEAFGVVTCQGHETCLGWERKCDYMKKSRIQSHAYSVIMATVSGRKD